MAVRNCSELGENLQIIMTRLMANDNLVKLLYYTNNDPLNQQNLSNVQKQKEIFNKLIKIVPIIDQQEISQSIISIRVDDGRRLSENNEFKSVSISIEVFTPYNLWLINDTNLRPFAILGEIQKSLNGRTINGLGKLDGGDFELSYLTKEVSCYVQKFEITAYD